jgi:hypothetical protein
MKMSIMKLACPMPRQPKFRLYVAEEPGALLVRHGTFKSIGKALVRLAELALVLNQITDYQVRMYWNGQEKLVTPRVDNGSLLEKRRDD